MYIDRKGEAIKQVSIWLPVDQYRLLKEDHLNLSQFVRDQLDVLYGEQSASETLDQKIRLIQSARESADRQKAVVEETIEARERLHAVTRQLRKERMAEREQRQAAENEAASRAAAIGDALDEIIGDGPIDRYRRMLPENDAQGDRIDLWESLVADVSRRCGAAVGTSEVAAELRSRLARADAVEGP
jgi:hypothetical protein